MARVYFNPAVPAGYRIVMINAKKFVVVGPDGTAAGSRSTFDGAVDMAQALASGVKPQRAPRAAAEPKAAAPKAAAPKQATSGGKKRDFGKITGPVSYKQAKLIGAAVGGLTHYLPASYQEGVDRKYGPEKFSHEDALTFLGVDGAKASRIIDALKSQDLVPEYGAAPDYRKITIARGIIEDIAGVRSPMMRPNPRSRRNW